MKLKPHGYFLVNFVTSFVEGEMSRHEFDMDYSGYVIEHFSKSTAGLPVVLPIPLILPMIWANTSRMMPCGLPWPMPWTTSLEIARTAIFSKFSNATGSRWHFLTTILCPFDDYDHTSWKRASCFCLGDSL